jgi:hypothetical protein
MTRSLNLLLAFLILHCCSATAQNKPGTGFFGGSNRDVNVCPASGNFMSEEDVNNLVSEMLGKIGAMNRFIIVACPQVDNCQATIFNGRPYILYNPEFLKSVRRLNFSSKELPVMQSKDWETLTVLAHELGHHINNHISNPLPGATQQEMELEADRSAGFMIYLMGGDLSQASVAYHAVSDKGTYTHPGRIQRIDALSKGFNDAASKYPRAAVVTPVPSPRTVTEPVRPITDKPKDVGDPSKNAEARFQEGRKLYYAKQYAEAYPILMEPEVVSHREAQYLLGMMYQLGEYVQKDKKEALRLYFLSAAQGYISAMNNIGVVYAVGGDGVVASAEEAAKWYRKAAEQGSTTSQTQLGELYLSGSGVKQDYGEAMQWFLKASKSSDRANYNIGKIYEKGLGVPVDLEKARSFYLVAQSKGSLSAKSRLAELDKSIK